MFYLLANVILMGWVGVIRKPCNAVRASAACPVRGKLHKGNVSSRWNQPHFLQTREPTKGGGRESATVKATNQPKAMVIHTVHTPNRKEGYYCYLQ